MQLEVKNEQGEIIAQFDLAEPTFEVKAQAIRMLLSGGDKPDLVGTGKVILDACYIGQREDLIKDDDIYLSACMACAGIVKVYESEIKKN